MKTMHLFAGGGGGLLSDIILGHTPVCAVEWDAYCCQVLRERAAEGWFPGLQVWEGDVRLFDPSEYAGKVSLIHAGFPCPPFSVAGKRRGGADERNMWPATARIVGKIRPEWVFLENVAGFVSSGYGWTVLSDLSGLGYDARWTCLGADQVGAPHERERWWLLAHATGREIDQRERGVLDEAAGRRESLDSATLSGGEDVAYTQGGTRQRQTPREARYASQCSKDLADTAGVNESRGGTTRAGRAGSPDQGGGHSPLAVGGVSHGMASDVVRHRWWEEEPEIGRVTQKEENRVAKLKALGNGQVPLQSAVAFKILMEGFKCSTKS